MTTTHYDRLSHLDNSFLALESRTTHMHVAAIAEFQTGPTLDKDGSIDADLIRRFVESKLHVMPRYRQRLAYVPIERHPVWVDDEHFNIEYHVRHTSLPKPGGHDQLIALMGRLVSQQLDRSKPLWELYIVEGVHDGHFALISKTHHAMIDGISGVDLMAALLNLAPVTDVADPEEFEPRPIPSGAELVVREGFRRAGWAMSLVKNATEIPNEAQTVLLEGVRRVRAVGHSLSSGWLSKAADTSLNGKVGPNRRFATLQMPLSDVKAVKNALGGSVNDVVLATVAGGVRRYLAETDGDIEDLDFRVMAPVSIRTPSDRGSMGNQVAMWLVSLPVSEPDPVARFAAVHAETEKLKRTDQALGASTLVRLSAGAPTTLVALAARLAATARPFNMTVTNVPGPQFPLYLLDSRLVATYPLVPLWEGHGAGIALFSYAGSLYWGINADWDLVPDLDTLVAALRASFVELQEAAATVAASGGNGSAPKRRPPLGTVRPSGARSIPVEDGPVAEKSPAITRSSASGGKAADRATATTKRATTKRATTKPETTKTATTKTAGTGKKPSSAKTSTAQKPAAATRASGARKTAASTKRSTAKSSKSSTATGSKSSPTKGTTKSSAKSATAKGATKPRPAARSTPAKAKTSSASTSTRRTSGSTKSASTKSTRAKSAEAKSTGAKSTGAKSTGAKSTGARSTSAKPARSKTAGAEKPAGSGTSKPTPRRSTSGSGRTGQSG